VKPSIVVPVSAPTNLSPLTLPHEYGRAEPMYDRARNVRIIAGLAGSIVYLVSAPPQRSGALSKHRAQNTILPLRPLLRPVARLVPLLLIICPR
jgi:hypothetical protein